MKTNWVKYLLAFSCLLIIIGCNNYTPTTVTSDEVQNNSEGIMIYKGQPFTGRVQDNENGYIEVENGVIKHMILCHSNGSTAIDMDFVNNCMYLKDEKGQHITKEEFLKQYPHFKEMSDAWVEVQRIN